MDKCISNVGDLLALTSRNEAEIEGVALDWADQVVLRGDYPRLLARLLRLQREDLDTLLRGTALTRSTFADPEALMSAWDQIRIYTNAVRFSDTPDLGLTFGRQLGTSAHGAVGLMIASSATLRDALQAVVDFMPTRINFIAFDLVSTTSQVRVSAVPRLPLEPNVERFLCDTLVTTFVEIARHFNLPSFEGIVANMPYDMPEDTSPYAEFVPLTYRFSEDRFMMSIPNSLCMSPNIQANATAFQIALQHCNDLLQKVSFGGSISAQVSYLMLSGSPGNLSAEEAAKALFMSPRTLARQLARDGTSFRKLREQTLARQADTLLSDPRLSVDAIAAHLHFHDSSSFRRAFRRWFGVPPDTYRKTSQRLR